MINDNNSIWESIKPSLVCGIHEKWEDKEFDADWKTTLVDANGWINGELSYPYAHYLSIAPSVPSDQQEWPFEENIRYKLSFNIRNEGFGGNYYFGWHSKSFKQVEIKVYDD